MSIETEAGYAVAALTRIAQALERMADADELRNNLLADEMVERRAAWEQNRQDQAEAMARIMAPIEMVEQHGPEV